MKKMLDLLSAEVAKAFAEAGYDEKYARVSLSNRPDLCEYQCNGAMAAAKEYHKAPIMIANAVVEAMQGSEVFGDCLLYTSYDTGDRAACHVFQSNGPAAGNSVIAGSVCAGCLAL